MTRILNRAEGMAPGDPVPPELELAALCGVSRTTVREALKHLEAAGVLERAGSRRRLRRAVQKNDYEGPKAIGRPRDEEVSRYLIEKIATGKLRPGQRLSERTLAREIGCSQAPVREALLALAPLGLLRKENRRQWEAVSLDPRQCDELTELRQIIECHCLRKLFATGWHAANRDTLESLLRKTEDLAKAREFNLPAFFEVDVTLHHLLLDASGNRLLASRNRFIYSLIQFQLSNLNFSSERARLGLRQHVRILRAMLDNNPREAEKALMRHLFAAGETLKQLGGV